MKQQRATRTRHALLQAAALEFDRSGYAGSSLTQISRSAGISMGALTFHFAGKEQLADVVRAHGFETTLAVVERVRESDDPPFQSAVALTLALVGVLEEDVYVRAAARLARERHEGTPDSWSALWTPVLLEQLRATPSRELRGDVAPYDVASLGVLLVTGAETIVRERACGPDAPADPAPDAVGQLAEVWRLILDGVAAPPAGGDADGARTGLPRPLTPG